MRLKIAVAAALLSLLMAPSANAQLTITLDPSAPSKDTFFGGDFAFGGTIFNSSASPVSVDGDSFTGPSGLGFIAGISNLPPFGDLPMTLTAGGSFTSNDLFELTVPAGTPIAGRYDLTSGGAVVGTLILPSPGVVPEPGSMALLVGSMMGGGLFLARRRRK